MAAHIVCFGTGEDASGDGHGIGKPEARALIAAGERQRWRFGATVRGYARTAWRLARPFASSVLVLAAAQALSLPASAQASEAACPNETAREESNVNPSTGSPYSLGLPECRAYEMVSPLYKQSQGAGGLNSGIALAPNGGAVVYGSQGDFAEPENYRVNFFPVNTYVALRQETGWVTHSALPPRNLIDSPFVGGLDGDLSPDLRSTHVSCGTNPLVAGNLIGVSVVCAAQQGGIGGRSWQAGKEFPTVGLASLGGSPNGLLGASEDLTRVFVQLNAKLLPEDTVESGSGLYEVIVPGTAESKPRLVNVDNNGVELNSRTEPPKVNTDPALLGNGNQKLLGTTYHAISSNGQTVFFAATPTPAQSPQGAEVQTVYARIPCIGGPHCHYVERNGEKVEGRETVSISDPTAAQCTACNTATPAPAEFQGATADASKVFFTTNEPLLSNEDSSLNLYEYDFDSAEGSKLKLISAAPAKEEATVLGVVRTSADGSHVYFVAEGVLTGAEENEAGESALKGKQNLYAYDTEGSGVLKFVATLTREDKELWGEGKGLGAAAPEFSDQRTRRAQTTPNGNFLVFSSFAKLAHDTNPGAQAVYGYDFETGELAWISQAAPGLQGVLKASSPNESDNAMVEALDGNRVGADADGEDWDRGISENGEDVVFTTAERLQSGDNDHVADVYLWHAGSKWRNGTVSMISAGGGVAPVISALGSDIVFDTNVELVPQDTDEQGDVYDARIGGGFKAPAVEGCTGEGCQGQASALPSFALAPSSLVPAEGNIGPAALAAIKPTVHAARKPLTDAPTFAGALKACQSKPKRARAACVARARRTYRAKLLAAAMRRCAQTSKQRRGACEARARRSYRR